VTEVPVRVVAALSLALAAVACGPGPDPAASTTVPRSSAAQATPSAPSVMSDGDAMLPTPFTAEQIRDEWVEGFRLTMRRWALNGERLERWRVVTADADGVEIEIAVVDAEGVVAGEPTIGRSTWQELRDHASFPAAAATRSRVSRSTALGELEGWRYTVTGPEAGMTSELFFADSLPGAPVQMTTWQAGEKVLELEQLDRARPPAAATE
jgi:hypothetical protein